MLNSSKYFRKHAQIRDSFVVKFSSHSLKILVEFKRAHYAGISEFHLSTEINFSNKYLLCVLFSSSVFRGGSRIFFRRGCTRLLLYFNTNKPHSFFFCRIPVVLENRRSSRGGVRTPCTLPLDPPLVFIHNSHSENGGKTTASAPAVCRRISVTTLAFIAGFPQTDFDTKLVNFFLK